ncbi:MAG: O-methyltransferase [Mycobacterium sp.]|jgi:methyltransferase (TIGR00027 family)|nr:O-methyltransferase [Mycobacterium sp.]
MARTDGDSWDLASSVGATATMVAAMRALASQQQDPLVQDPYADPLVRAVGTEFFVRLLDGEIEPPNAGEGADVDGALVIDSPAVRTKFFDEFFLTAAGAGIRQAVILAAGLDSRPYRLPWPPDSVVYEIDQPQVIDFKTTTLSGLGAEPTAQRRTVAVDLRDDWPAALRRNGFDTRRPTAWSAEGLLIYLPPEAQDRLFDSIAALSAPGSMLATEYRPGVDPLGDQRRQTFTERLKNLGCEIDVSDLAYRGDRRDVADYLTAAGWDVSTRDRLDLFGDYGRPVPDLDALGPFGNVVAVTATKNKDRQ